MANFPFNTTMREIRITARYDTVLTTLLDGTVLRFNRRAEPLYTIDVILPMLSAANLATLDAFYRSCKGAYTRFTLKDPVARSWTETTINGTTEHGIYVGTGDGATATFDCPGKTLQASVVAVYTENPSTGVVTVVRGANYAVTDGAGTDGRAQLVFGAGKEPSSGHRIGIGWTSGYRAWWAVFGDSLQIRRTYVNWDTVDSITCYEARS